MKSRRRSAAARSAVLARRRDPGRRSDMDFGRVAVSAIGAWVAFLVVNSFVSPVLLDEFYRAHATLFRRAADQHVALGFGVGLVGFFVFAYAYAKGYEGGGSAAEGLRFGVLVGLLLACFSVAWTYALTPMSGGFAVALVIDTIVEMALYGVLVGLVYRPRQPGTPDRR